jgi:hypothetical protein
VPKRSSESCSKICQCLSRKERKKERKKEWSVAKFGAKVRWETPKGFDLAATKKLLGNEVLGKKVKREKKRVSK